MNMYCRDADDAVYDLHGKDLLGYKVTVEHAKETSKYFYHLNHLKSEKLSLRRIYNTNN